MDDHSFRLGDHCRYPAHTNWGPSQLTWKNMGTTTYFESELYPPQDGNGRADTEQPATTVAVVVSNFYVDHQIYLQITDGNGDVKPLHLTKDQAKELIDGLQAADSYIGYDNTEPPAEAQSPD